MAIKIIKKIAIGLGIVLLLSVSSLFVVLRYYEDDVVAFAFEKSKDIFTRQVNIDNIDLAFWHTFPNASLHLESVFIPDSFQANDTLLHADDVYLEFNLFDLFHGQYELLELEVSNATTKIKFNAKGEDNYHFWKPSSDSTGFRIALEEVLLTDLHFYYRDEQAHKVIDLQTSQSRVAGDLTEDQCDLDIGSRFFIKEIWSNHQTLWQNQNIDAEVLVKADFAEKNFLFGTSTIALGEIQTALEGVINTKKDPYFDLSLSGKDIQLPQLISLLPKEQEVAMEEYDLNGQVGLNIMYKGTLSARSSPLLIMNVVLNNGKLQSPDGEVELNEINFESHAEYKSDTWLIKINRCSAALAGGQILASGAIETGAQTHVDMQLQANADANDLKHFFNLDTLEVCAGQIHLEVLSKGVLKMASGDSIVDFAALQNTGKATWHNGEIKLKNSNRHFTSLKAAVELDNANAHVKSLSGIVNGCDFNINGSFKNLVPFLIDDKQRLLIEANLSSQVMDFNQMLETSSGSEEAYQLVMPKRIDFAFQSKVKRFVFRQFYADDLTCVAHLQEGRFFIDPLHFKTASGQLNAQLSLNQTNADHYYLNCLANIEQMDIQELFREFENFDQTFIQDRHLRGKANAQVQFQAPITTALDVQYKDLYSVIDLKIQEGQLIGLESLQEIAAYIKTNKWIAPFVDENKFAEKLQDVRFSTLENTIVIKDEVIEIPMMDIKSTAMDISISGRHQFNNNIDYTIGFNLRDVLVRKQKEYQEQDDGLGKQIFIFMRGTTENPEFGVDREAAKGDRKAEMQVEKQNMKALLKEEFGLFKRDNQIGAFKETIAPKETTTTIDWEGFDQKEETTLPKEKDKPNNTSPIAPDTKPKKTPKWLKEKE